MVISFLIDPSTEYLLRGVNINKHTCFFCDYFDLLVHFLIRWNCAIVRTYTSFICLVDSFIMSPWHWSLNSELIILQSGLFCYWCGYIYLFYLSHEQICRNDCFHFNYFSEGESFVISFLFIKDNLERFTRSPMTSPSY